MSSSSLAPVPGPEPGAALVPAIETAAVGIAARMKAEVESRYLMALQRPRDWAKAEAQIVAACSRPRFAEEAKYRVPRGRDKHIEGLSVRFAEEVVRALGNIMVEAAVVHEDAEQRIVRVAATDLENNVTYPADVVIDKTVERQSPVDREVLGTRMNSENKRVYRVRATDEEVLNKQNSLVSKTLRNAVLRFLPADLQESALALIASTLQRGAKAEGALDRLERAFGSLKVSRADLEGYLGHGLDTLAAEEFEDLRGLYEAIREGTTTWADAISAVPQVRKTHPRAVRSDAGAEAGGSSPAPEVRRATDRPVPQGQKPPDPYLAPRKAVGGRCEHGVLLEEECLECRELYQ